MGSLFTVNSAIEPELVLFCVDAGSEWRSGLGGIPVAFEALRD